MYNFIKQLLRTYQVNNFFICKIICEHILSDYTFNGSLHILICAEYLLRTFQVNNFFFLFIILFMSMQKNCIIIVSLFLNVIFFFTWPIRFGCTIYICN